MAKFIRKLKNAGPIDAWLENLGYYRKNIAYDETCLFRAIAEQQYISQVFHERVRKEMIVFAKENRELFQELVADDNEWCALLEQLDNHMAICGSNEMNIISKLYGKQVLLFDGVNKKIIDIGDETSIEPFLICHTGDDHYDAIRKLSYIKNSGFCQSIVYSILYENVFHISNVSDIVEEMLGQKPKPEEDDNKIIKDSNFNSLKLNKRRPEMKNELKIYLKTNVAPFPFKVAKALDPKIYRNIEYDSWIEMRRELRLGDWYFGDNNLIRGTACILNHYNTELKCYIQDINKKDNTCEVYIINTAEKRTVNLCDLKPEANAKPWPIPYRFTKNSPFVLPKVNDKLNDSIEDNSLEILELEDDMNNNLIKEQFSGSNAQNQWNLDNSEVINEEEDSIIESEDPFNVMMNGVWNCGNNFFNLSKISENNNHIYDDNPEQNCSPYDVWPNGQYVAPLPSSQNLPPTPQSTADLPQTPLGLNFVLNEQNVYSPNSEQHYSSISVVQHPYPETFSPVVPVAPPGTPVIYSPNEGQILIPTTPNIQHISIPSPHVIVSPQVAILQPIEMPYVESPTFVCPVISPVTWYPQGINAQGFIYPSPDNIQS